MLVRTLRGLAAASLLVVAVSSVGQAQEASSSRFAVTGGIVAPMGDFGDAADMGFQVGGSWTKGLNDMFKLRINADYSRLGTKVADGTFTQLGALANLVHDYKGGMYALAGLGMINTTIDVGGINDSNADLAWNVGGGFNVNKWFIEARYQSINADGGSVNSLPIVFGILPFSGLSLPLPSA